ncbi:MAG: OmpH family outer membrane protein [Alphaproteobacteria bacterium]|nr:OmpH family outer membrane protein [Alphaproteobacteria bacterium]
MRYVLAFIIAFWAVAAAAEVAPSPPGTAATPRFPILIVDVKHVLDDSKAAISAQKKIEVQRSAFQDEISSQEKKIREAEQELVQQRGKLDEKAYAEKETQLRQKFRDVEKYVQERRATLEKATSQSLGKVHDVMKDIVSDIAKKRGAQLVLAKQGNQAVLWTIDGNDITAEVSARLNAQLPDIAVNIDVPDAKKDPTK